MTQTEIETRLHQQEMNGPNRAHVPLLRRILTEMKQVKESEQAWQNAVRTHHTSTGKLSYQTRISYTVRPWLLAVLGERDLLATPIEAGTEASDHIHKPTMTTNAA